MHGARRRSALAARLASRAILQRKKASKGSTACRLCAKRTEVARKCEDVSDSMRSKRRMNAVALEVLLIFTAAKDRKRTVLTLHGAQLCRNLNNEWFSGLDLDAEN